MPEAHRFADLFPLIHGDEFNALVADIREHGLRVPIVLHQGHILDGRNRLAACRAAGVEPRFETFNGSDDEALALVISLNLARRHLTTAQRAALAVKLLPLEEAAALRRMHAGRPPATQEPPQIVAEVPTRLNGEANAVAGHRVGVSRETVRKARKLSEEHPTVFAAMEQGVLRTLGEAERVADLKSEAAREAVLEVVRGRGVRVDEAIRIVQGVPPALLSHESEDWETPDGFLALVRAVLGEIDLDPASSPKANTRVKARRIFTRAEDGIVQRWSGRVYLNPPFGVTDGRSNQGTWSAKLIEEYQAGNVTEAVLLVNARTEAAWFWGLWAYPMCLVRGAIPFIPADPARVSGNAKCGQAFVYFGPSVAHFRQVFEAIGRLVLPVCPSCGEPSLPCSAHRP